MIDKRMVWELIKYEIRKFTIQYAKQKKRKQVNFEKELETRLIEMERNTITDSNVMEYEHIKKQLKEIENEKIKGMLVRSRVEWHEKGEKSTKYFFDLEKNNALKKHIRKLVLSNGTTTTDPQSILNEQMSFYKDLLSSKLEKDTFEDSKYFKSKSIPELLPIQRILCEGLITFDECKKLLPTFKRNKSPGNDGLTIEFYEYFWSDIDGLLVDSYNYAFQHGELSTSQKQAIISLIHKKEIDRLYLKNWRPISLLNVDYKIGSKVIAERIKKVLPFLVHSDQSGFIEGYMSDTIRTLNDMLHYASENDEEGLFMMVDYEKAYDCLEWNFILKSLERYKFGPMLIRWIKTFYTNIESCVTNNHTSSRYFKVTRGLRQGDPLSSYLFVLCVELLSIAIREDDRIEGMKVNGVEAKLAQYADDTTAILRNLQSAEHFLQTLHEFSKISGLKINKEKTEAMWLGPNRHNNARLLQIKWTNGPIKILGVYIGHEVEPVIEANFKTRIQNLKCQLNIWKQRKLSIIGKILILKTFGMSQFIFLANLIPFPEEKIKEINEICYEFIWNSKTCKVKRNIMIQDYEQGGMRMPDLKTIIKVQKLKWIKLVMNNHDAFWINSMKQLIGVSNLKLFFLCNWDINDYCIKCKFYKELLECFCEVRYIDSSDSEGISSQYIYYNKLLKIGGNYFYIPEFLQAGIWTISDLYEDGIVIPFEVWQRRGLPAQLYYQWMQIIDCIKQKCKHVNIVSCDNKRHIYMKYRDVDVVFDTKKSRQMYDIMIKDRKDLSPAKCKLSKLFNIELNSDVWKIIYCLPLKCVKVNKVKEMQFKILHRYLATNKLLFNMQKVASPKCSFCNLNDETITHLFFECTLLKCLWNHVNIACSNICNEKIKLSCKDIVLGYFNENEKVMHIVNKYILYVKYYIQQCKYDNVIPSIRELKRALMYHIPYEKELLDIVDNLTF